MKTILRANDLWDIVENGAPKSADSQSTPPSTGSSSISINETLRKDAEH